MHLNHAYYGKAISGAIMQNTQFKLKCMGELFTLYVVHLAAMHPIFYRPGTVSFI